VRAGFGGCDSGMATPQSQSKPRMECQRFVSGHQLFVSHTRIPKFMCVRGDHTQVLSSFSV